MWSTPSESVTASSARSGASSPRLRLSLLGHGLSRRRFGAELMPKEDLAGVDAERGDRPRARAVTRVSVAVAEEERRRHDVAGRAQSDDLACAGQAGVPGARLGLRLESLGD